MDEEGRRASFLTTLNPDMNLRRVVVTGLGTVNPIGNNIEEYFRNLEQGVGGAATITLFDASKFKTQFACEVKGFDPNQHFDRKEARKYDRFTQFALVAAKEAVQDAGLVDGENNTFDSVDKDRVGVVWASGIGGIGTFFDEVVYFAKGDGTPKYNPFFIPKMIADIAAGHISMKYGFRGPNYCTVSACSSSNHAFIDALNLIRWGKADVIVSGGSEAAINPAGIGGFNAMQALSTRNDDPATASRPYDTGRDGFVMGEGAGALVLEEYEHAKARGAKIYAEVIGGGLPPHGAGSGRGRSGAGHARGVERCRHYGRSDRLHQHARDFDAGGRLAGNEGDCDGLGGPCLRGQYQLHEVHDRPLAGRGGGD